MTQEWIEFCSNEATSRHGCLIFCIGS